VILFWFLCFMFRSKLRFFFSSFIFIIFMPMTRSCLHGVNVYYRLTNFNHSIDDVGCYIFYVLDLSHWNMLIMYICAKCRCFGLSPCRWRVQFSLLTFCPCFKGIQWPPCIEEAYMHKGRRPICTCIGAYILKVTFCIARIIY
jgi:hypothetical protein